MTGSQPDEGGYTLQLRMERLLDEFEVHCRTGELPTIAAFLRRHRDASPSTLREFEKIAQQYGVDLSLLASEIPFVAEEKPTTMGRSAAYVEETALISPSPLPVSAKSSAFNPLDARNYLAPPQAQGELGRIGGFRVLSVLGSGGMGTVFLGEDPRLDRQIAIKVMRPQIAAIAGAKERFLREARMMAAIDNDHVVHVFHVGEEGEIPFLTMPLLKGATLDQLLKKHRVLPAHVALRIAYQISLGLAAAHAKGLIHRDIKPANVWIEIRKTWRVKLLDFGLARIEQGDVSLTGHGELLGTPAYMAPEQARGEEIDARADLFSVGAVMYEMLTGRRPFDGPNTLSVLAKIAAHSPEPPSSIDDRIAPDVSRFVMKLLQKEAADRPASAAEAAKQLSRFLSARKSPQVHGENGPSNFPSEQPIGSGGSQDAGTLHGGSQPTIHNAPALLDFDPDPKSLASFQFQFGRQTVRLERRPILIAGAATLLSFIVFPIAAILYVPNLYVPKWFSPTNPDRASTPVIEKNSNAEGPEKSASAAKQGEPLEIKKDPPIGESKAAETSNPEPVVKPGSNPVTGDSNTIKEEKQPALNADSPKREAPKPPLRTIVRRFAPNEPMAVAEVGKRQLEIVLLEPAESDRFSTSLVKSGGSGGVAFGYTQPNLVLGIRVAPTRPATVSLGISAKYELRVESGQSQQATLDEGFVTIYPLDQPDLLPLCVYVPLGRSRVRIESLKGFLISQPQSRSAVELTAAEARRGATKSKDGFRFQVESISGGSGDLEVTVAVMEPATPVTNPQDFQKMILARMNRRLEVRLKDSQGDFHSPTAMEPIGGGSGFSFQTEFRFGGMMGPNGGSNTHKSSGANQTAPNRFTCRFPALPEKTNLSKVECAVVSPTGDPTITPFEFNNILVAE